MNDKDNTDTSGSNEECIQSETTTAPAVTGGLDSVGDAQGENAEAPHTALTSLDTNEGFQNDDSTNTSTTETNTAEPQAQSSPTECSTTGRPVPQLVNSTTLSLRPKAPLQRTPVPPPINTEDANREAEDSLCSKLLSNTSPLSLGIDDTPSGTGIEDISYLHHKDSKDADNTAPSSFDAADCTVKDCDENAPHLEKPDSSDSIAKEDKAKSLIGVSFSKNRRYRRTMEDAHLHIYDFDSVKGQALIAVFDGHAGRQAAQWCSDNFEKIFLDTMKQNKDMPMPEIFDKTFVEIDRRLADDVKTHSGCTAAVAFLEVKPIEEGGTRKSKRILHCANAGDARVVLSRNGEAVRLTYDHKGEDLYEARRIMESGGYVFHGRVNGILAVTRALGDSSLKQVVIGNPYTTETELSDTDQLLIVACDGLWDVCTDQEAVELIKDNENPTNASQTLLEYALDNESMDNVTIIVFRIPKAPTQ